MSIYKTIATCGIVGYFPIPGTVASALALVAVYALDAYMPWWVYAGVLISVIGIGYYAVARSSHEFPTHDPCCIVIDEVAGVLTTFAGVAVTPFTLGLGFLLFRFFDIAKPGPIGIIDRMNGIHAVMLDDIVAGICAQIVLRLCMYAISS